MTPEELIAAIDRMRERTKHWDLIAPTAHVTLSALARADVLDLIAEVDRLRALVTCEVCGSEGGCEPGGEPVTTLCLTCSGKERVEYEHVCNELSAWRGGEGDGLHAALATEYARARGEALEEAAALCDTIGATYDEVRGIDEATGGRILRCHDAGDAVRELLTRGEP